MVSMTDFPNASPPPGALFDNAPTVPTSPPSHLTPATRIARGRNGQWYGLEVLMQYGAPISADLAVKRVGIGRTVFVRREDAGQVLEVARHGKVD